MAFVGAQCAAVACLEGLKRVEKLRLMQSRWLLAVLRSSQSRETSQSSVKELLPSLHRSIDDAAMVYPEQEVVQILYQCPRGRDLLWVSPLTLGKVVRALSTHVYGSLAN
jgi:hypothetical protein